MSRMRKPSPATMGQIAARRTTQMQAAAAVAVASNTAAVVEEVASVQANVDAIDIDTINDTLTAYDARLTALETP